MEFPENGKFGRKQGISEYKTLEIIAKSPEFKSNLIGTITARIIYTHGILKISCS